MMWPFLFCGITLPSHRPMPQYATRICSLVHSCTGMPLHTVNSPCQMARKHFLRSDIGCQDNDTKTMTAAWDWGNILLRWRVTACNESPLFRTQGGASRGEGGGNVIDHHASVAAQRSKRAEVITHAFMLRFCPGLKITNMRGYFVLYQDFNNACSLIKSHHIHNFAALLATQREVMMMKVAARGPHLIS